jgi:hypothetical protein
LKAPPPSGGGADSHLSNQEESSYLPQTDYLF